MGAQYVTAVALYGPKPAPLEAIVRDVQEIVHDHIGSRFKPYSMEQIHGTLVGLDGFVSKETGDLISEYYYRYRGEVRIVDLEKAFAIIANALTPPLNIQIGGFAADYEDFTSRGGRAYLRTFTCQGNATVLMGWPVETRDSFGRELPLDGLRRGVNDAGVLHRYHRMPADVDNDFYMVLGHFDSTSEATLGRATAAVREHVASHPIVLAIAPENVTIVAADSATLYPAQYVGQFPWSAHQVRKFY